VTERCAATTTLPTRWPNAPTPRVGSRLTGASTAFADALVAHPELVRSLYHLPSPEHPLFPDEPQAS
jgi:hypothetical protein